MNLAKYKPQDIVKFCIKWFKDRKIKNDSESQEDQEKYPTINDKEFKKIIKQKIQTQNRSPRYGVCAEVYGPFNRRKQFILRKGHKKSEKTQLRILFFISNSFLFKNFNEYQINLLTESMNQKQTFEGQVIIQQGDSGDQMFIVDQGEFQCFQENQNKQRRLLKRYRPGNTFGQSATVISTKPGKLYSLGREVYKHFKKMSIIKKKILYIESLKKVKLFEDLNADQFQKLCDVLEQVTFQAGSFVIIEGDIGTKFYIILEGVLVALKGPQQKIIQCYKQGDYFGQLALLNDVPRQASVKCLTKSALVYLTQDVFKRIISKISSDRPLQEKYRRKPVLIKKRNQQRA